MKMKSVREFFAKLGAWRDTPGAASVSAAPASWRLYVPVAALGVTMFAIALSGYPNLLDNERRIGAYVLDAVRHGHWIMQYDVTGGVASKPPLLTWIAALSTAAFGEINRFSIYLPSALATLGVALLLVGAGKKHFSWRAGFLAGLIYLLCPAGDRQFVTARYDGLLALPVTLAALAAYHAWTTGRGWTWFWLAGAMGTMAKGPIALVLGGAGLLAHFWEKRARHESKLRGSHWLGLALFVAICGGWFWLAYQSMGQPLIDKLLGRELAAHATGSGMKEKMFVGFYEPTLAVLSNLAPWCAFALIAFWRVWKRPSENTDERRFERFLFCWFFAGLVLFSIAAHQRGRLVFPLFPAAALLAARELAWWLRGWSTPRLFKTAAVFAACVLAFLVLYHHVLQGRSTRVQATLGMRDVAAQVRGTLGEQFPLVHVETPFALQFWLNTAHRLVKPERAADLLRGAEPVVVAVGDFPELENFLSTNRPVLHELARWPAKEPTLVRVISNRPFTNAPAGRAKNLSP